MQWHNVGTNTAGGSSPAPLETCNCVGPQNGQPVCPCQMRHVVIENGRYVLKKDLGPAPAGAMGSLLRLGAGVAGAGNV